MGTFSDILGPEYYFDPVEELARLDELALMEYCNEQETETDSNGYGWEIQGRISDSWESGTQTCGGGRLYATAD